MYTFVFPCPKKKKLSFVFVRVVDLLTKYKHAARVAVEQLKWQIVQIN